MKRGCSIPSAACDVYGEECAGAEIGYTTAKTGFDRAEGEEERKAKLPQLYEDFKGMVSK